MNRRKRIRKRTQEAAQWYFMCRNDEHFDRAHKRAFACWLRCRENMAEYLRFAEWVASQERGDLTQRTPQARGENIVPLFDHPSAEPTPARNLISRRGVLAAAAGFSGVYIAGAWITSPRTRVVSTRRSDVIASGHVQRVSVPGGVMHLARNSSLWIDDLGRTVHVLSGQAAFELAQGMRSITRVTTPFGKIAVAAARFGVVVAKSMAHVSVTEGDVRVVSSTADPVGTVLTAGRKLTLQPGVKHVPVILANAQRELAWTQGDLYFTDETFGEAAAAFNRFNTLQIRPSATVAGLSIGAHHCSLSDPQRFINRYADAWGLASRREGDVIHIFTQDEAQEPR